MDTSTSVNNSPTPEKITVRSVKRQAETAKQLLSFEVHVQVELGGHKVAWTMSMLPGARVAIRLDESQQVTLIAHEDLLIDSSRAGTLAIRLLEGEPDGQE